MPNTTAQHTNQLEQHKRSPFQEDVILSADELIDDLLVESRGRQRDEPITILFSALDQIHYWRQLPPHRKVDRVLQLHENRFKDGQYTGIREELRDYKNEILVSMRDKKIEAHFWPEVAIPRVRAILMEPCKRAQESMWPKKHQNRPWIQWLALIVLQVVTEHKTWEAAVAFIQKNMPKHILPGEYTGNPEFMKVECKKLTAVCQKLDIEESAPQNCPQWQRRRANGL
ncbi:hypothetical protein NEDG_01128 [Nematocida displodere]|uniref:Uncharacterized protein n=1 Tax=Nematocida displodere TaxID=1805483 RepID=A0A177EDB4_9MICR|nr:hypothetical protein NEDG_01128 [Nematocida displodere]